jgi:hypothetical protein
VSRRLLALAALLSAGAARGQTMLDQEQRLIEVHSLLLALPALQAPGGLASGEATVGLELVAIPLIDGTTGGKRQITASDRTRAFPRPRLALGLAGPAGTRATLGLAYVPPVEVNGVASHQGALEAGLARALGPVWLGLRGQLVYGRSRSPVTDPATRDTLTTWIAGADLSVGWPLDAFGLRVAPYATVGVARVSGDFRVTSDGYLLRSRTTNLSLGAGLRVALPGRLDAAAELVAWPGRLVHPSFRLAWAPDLGWAR